MTILSIDYGDARTGVAVCDCFEMLASPVEVIHQNYDVKVLERIKEICEKLNPSKIIVGLPKNMNGSIGERGEKCIAFSQEIYKATLIPTEMWDERLTTVEAHNYLNNTNTRGKKRKNVVDAVAATIILQDYLDYRKSNNLTN